MKSQYVAEDGSVHDTPEDCQKYESVLSKKSVIETWAQANYGPRMVTKSINTILKWESDRDEAMLAVEEEA